MQTQSKKLACIDLKDRMPVRPLQRLRSTLVKIQFVLREDGVITERGNIVEAIGIDQGWFQFIDDMGDAVLIPPRYVDVVEGDAAELPVLKDYPDSYYLCLEEENKP